MKRILSSPLMHVILLAWLFLVHAMPSMADCITNPITVNAGNDAFTYACTIPPPVSLTGLVTGSATSIVWTTSGTGTFSPANSANTTYYPSTTDPFGTGQVTLTLTVSGGGCTVSDALILSFVLYTPNAYSGPNQTVCSTVASVQLAGSSIAATHTWSTKGTGTGTFTPNNTALNAQYIPSAADIANGSVKLTLMPSGDPCGLAQPMTVTFLKVATSPASATICENVSATFATTVSAGYSGAVSYQWQVNKGSGFVNVNDLTNEYTNSATATLTLKANVATNAYNSYQYRAVVSACSTTYNSNAATLTVKSNTLTVTDPSDQSACVGGSAVFTSSVNPNTIGVTYRWMSYNGTTFVNMNNGANVSGVTTPVLTLSNVTAGMDAGQYRLSATNGCAATQFSGAKQLHLSNLTFTGQPQPAIICAGGSANFDVTVSGDVVTSYQWQVNNGGGFVNITDGPAYSGASTNSLSILNAAVSMNSYLYQCLVKSSCSPAGKTSGSAQLTVNSSISITSAPTEQTVCEGQTADFSVTVSGAATYRWQVNEGSGFSDISDNALYTNSTAATLTVNAGILQNGFIYRAVVQAASGCATSVNSSEALLNVRSTALVISSSPSPISACEGAAVSFSVTAAGTGITYQWQEDAGSGFTDLTEGGIYTHVTSPSLDLSDILTAMDGRKYQVVVSTACRSISSSEALLTVFATPLITAQPVDVTSWNDGSVAFSCNASGSNLQYQWQSKGTLDADFSDLSNVGPYIISGNSLILSSTTSAWNGAAFRCVITSLDCAAGTLTTREALLTTASIDLCMVTTDETSGKNVIVFDKPANLAGVDSFLVYRDNGSGDFEWIGRLYKDAMSTFIDEDADPSSHSYRYQVTVLDVNKTHFPINNASSLNSIHLGVTPGAGQSLQLTWNSYDQNPANTYTIYRGLTSDAMNIVGTVTDDGTSYTDNSAPAADLFYQIELVLSTSCNPTARTSVLASSKSNKVEQNNTVTGTDQSSAFNEFVLYPNPASDVVLLTGLLEESTVITVYDLSGSPVKSISTTSSSLSFSVNELSKGLYLMEVQNSYGINRRSLVIE
jgi:hypothetical protein